MKTIRRLIYGEAMVAIALVALGFLALFFFFDLADELQYLGKNNGLKGDANIYQLRHALLYVALLIPNRLYDLLPISVLIGAIFVMTRLAQSSEYTILRTSGLGPWRALRLLLALGAFFVALSFLLGEYVVPPSEQAAQLLKARYRGKISVGQTGAWLKEKQTYNTYVVNIKELSPDNKMHGIEIFEFDNKGLIVSTTQAPIAVFAAANDAWQLQQASRAEFDIHADPAGTAQARESAKVTRSALDSFRWPTGLSAEMVSVALLNPDRMGTIDLFNYIRHLNANGQLAQRYEIQFWKKIFYPLSCLVMVILALPFAYLHFRTDGIAGYVFAGVMIGISFFLLNNVFGYIGNLRNWQPWLAAAAPGLLYMAASLGAFGWLVFRH
jgi:lipopolysaccharide export system permease protein